MSACSAKLAIYGKRMLRTTHYTILSSSGNQLGRIEVLIAPASETGRRQKVQRYKTLGGPSEGPAGNCTLMYCLGKVQAMQLGTPICKQTCNSFWMRLDAMRAAAVVNYCMQQFSLINCRFTHRG